MTNDTPLLSGPSTAGSDPTRAALLDAAHALLSAGGPEALTVRAIATRAGMSTMNVYSRFGGKDGVLDELFSHGFRQLAEQMRRAPTTVDPLADLRRCGHEYRRFARERATTYSLMFERPVPEYRPSLAARTVAMDALVLLAERVERAMAEGALRRGDPFVAASALWSLVHGLASLEAATAHDHDDGEPSPFEWDDIADVAVDGLLAGLR